MITHILFDLDGTITNSAEGITKSVQYALLKYDIKELDHSKLKRFIGPSLKESFSKFYGFSEEKSLEAVDYFREYFKETGIFENKLYPQIEETLITLKNQNKHLAIATAKPTVFAERILNYFNLSHYFDHIVGSNLDDTRMEKVEIISEVLLRFDNPDPDNCIMIGDRRHDIHGAQPLGIKTVGCSYGFGGKEELTLAGADYIISHHSELLKIEVL